jgi:hypothetical protein
LTFRLQSHGLPLRVLLQRCTPGESDGTFRRPGITSVLLGIAGAHRSRRRGPRTRGDRRRGDHRRGQRWSGWGDHRGLAWRAHGGDHGACTRWRRRATRRYGLRRRLRSRHAGCRL